MISSKLKILSVVLVLLVFTGVIAAGCGKKAEKHWVNTDSLPGHTFSQYSSSAVPQKSSNSKVVYLGETHSYDANFGPRDVSFEFKSLKN